MRNFGELALCMWMRPIDKIIGLGKIAGVTHRIHAGAGRRMLHPPKAATLQIWCSHLVIAMVAIMAVGGAAVNPLQELLYAA